LARIFARTDALLAVIALCLLGVWLFIERNPAEVPTAHPFEFLEDALPEHVTVTTPRDTIAVAISPNSAPAPRYQIQGSANIPVDEATVDQLLLTLKNLEVVRDVAKTVTKNELGLTSPDLGLSFSSKNHTYRVSLGKECPSPEKSRYALLAIDSNERMVVLSPQTVALLQISPERLIFRRVTDWLPSEVDTVKMSRNYRDITIIQQKSGQFVLGGVPIKRAKRGPVERLLLALTELKVNFYLDVAPSPQEQSLNITLTRNDEHQQQVVEFRFFGRCPKDPSLTTVFITDQKTRYGCIESSVLEGIPLTAESFDDNHLFFLHDDEVEKLTVTAKNNSFTLERQGTAFRLLSPEEKAVTLAAGNQLLKALVSATGRALGPCDASKVASSTIQLRSGLVGKKSFFDETLRMGTELPTFERLVCRDDNEMFLVDPKTASTLELDSSMLENPKLLNATYESVDEVTVVRANVTQHLSRNTEGELVLTSPKAPSDPASIESLTERLAQLSAERMLPRSQLEKLRSRAPAIMVRFSAKAEGSDILHSHEVKLYRTEAPYVVATLDALPAPFVISDLTYELLDGVFVDRSMYRLTEEDHAFSLSRRTDLIHCKKTERSYWCPGSTLSENQIERIVANLSQLRAARVDLKKGAKPREELVLKVYEKETAAPRFTLKFGRPTEVDPSTFYFAESERQNFNFYFRNSDVSELLSVFEDQPKNAHH
jgi:hypothetical protein